VARRLGVKVRHVRRLVSETRIPFVKWGHLLRFDPAEIERGSTGHAGQRRIERVKGDARRLGHERLWTPSGRDRSWHGSQHPLPADIRLPVGGRLGATRDTAHSEVVRH
jgi:excisionase family DNA binding protein